MPVQCRSVSRDQVEMQGRAFPGQRKLVFSVLLMKNRQYFKKRPSESRPGISALYG